MPSTAADSGRRPVEPGRPPVFIADRASLERDLVTLSGLEGRHAATVRRLRPGARADLVDGAGLIAECEVVGSASGALELTVLSRRVEPQPEPRICVVQALPKGERGELAVETMTEVGVDVIVPWAAERCVAVWTAAGGKAERGAARWRRTAQEASKQSRRARFPEVTPLAQAQDALGRVRAAARAVVLDPVAELSLAALPLPAAGEIVLVVGPEGGLSPAETEAFAAAGAVGAHLGPTVLRSSTAGTAAAAVLLSRCGRW
ncbi:MAG TPA: 16S rRNA (uracil(1498)-N(3))-methyltransferase [Streptosporangiaceae bacterium]|jgi:16S rRNA (uracil1498-N3)-methyltransferase